MNNPPRSALLLLNPVAHRAGSIDARAALMRLHQWGANAEARIPASASEFAEFARSAAHAGTEMLLVAGGDGSLRLAAGAIAGSRTALACLPAGTANVFAKEAGIPTDWEQAIDLHMLGQRLRMDLGRAGGEPFLLMAGIGWDAEIASHVSLGLKKRVGAAAYMVEALKALPKLHPATIELTMDGEDYAGEWGLIVVGNTRLYGGLVRFTPGAVANDGLLDLCALGPRRAGQGAALGLKLATGRLGEGDYVLRHGLRELDVHTPGLAVQVDGDVIGQTPMNICVEPGAVVVSVPPGPLPSLFGA
jgi:diacylglycerol kinase (ATP)